MMRLQVRHLRLPLPGHPARRLEIDALDLPQGQWVALVGANGSGKSTFLKSIATTAGLSMSDDHADGRSPPAEILLDGKPLAQWRRRERARRLAWLPQTVDHMDSGLSVEQTVMLGRLPWLGLTQTPGERDRAAVVDALARVDALALRDRQITHLSGGELQRVLIARVLAAQAGVYLLDEPFDALDAAHQQALLATLGALSDQGTSTLVVVHDLNIALQADAIVVLLYGRATAVRSPQEPDLHSDLERAFGGAIEILKHPAGAGWIALPRRVRQR